MNLDTKTYQIMCVIGLNYQSGDMSHHGVVAYRPYIAEDPRHMPEGLLAEIERMIVFQHEDEPPLIAIFEVQPDQWSSPIFSSIDMWETKPILEFSTPAEFYAWYRLGLHPNEFDAMVHEGLDGDLPGGMLEYMKRGTQLVDKLLEECRSSPSVCTNEAQPTQTSQQ